MAAPFQCSDSRWAATASTTGSESMTLSLTPLRTVRRALDTATGRFSLSPPAERWERGTNAVADKDSSYLPT